MNTPPVLDTAAQQLAEALIDLLENENTAEAREWRTKAARQQYLASLTYMNTLEAAEYIGIGRSDLYKLVNAGRIPQASITRKKLRFAKTDLDQFMHSHMELNKPIATRPRRNTSAKQTARANSSRRF